MGDSYGSSPVRFPGFAEADGGRSMSVTDLPGYTVRHMAMFMDKLPGMHEHDPLAFEVRVRHVASMIEDHRRKEGRTNPRETPPPETRFPWDDPPPHASAPASAATVTDGSDQRGSRRPADLASL
jgi:hypothetical protein